jgi:tol-pal system protein YbgF
MAAMRTSIFTSSFLALFVLTSSLSSVAYAETDNQKIDRLERDLQIIQRQLSRGEVTPGSTGDAQLEVRLSAIEDEMRNLRGKAEENEFQIRRLSDNFERMQRDIDLRFSDLSKMQTTPAPESTMNQESQSITPPGSDDAPSEDTSEEPSGPSGTTSSTDTSGFATPREHYNYAFRLLNQTKYQDAADAFEDFTKKYPKDQLVGNAYYWQGETYYIRRDYINAADMFRQGFETLPDGPKAADNLLKLAMSLNALKRDKEACVVLEQLSTKYIKVSKSIATRAVQEQKRIGCNKN